MAMLDALGQRVTGHPWRPWHAGLSAFGALAALALGLFALDYVLRPDSFPVRRMSFEGPFQMVEQQALADALVESVRGNFFLLDLEAVRTRAQSVPWVHAATVRRLWPDGVHVRFTEQQLVARWGRQGWVNAHGEPVDLRGQPGPAGLPLLAGPDGLQARVLEHYHRLSELLAPVGLQIARLTLSDRRSWSVVLDNGVTLTLGREEPEPKVARFARVYPRALASHAARIRRVDLRYTNGFSVEWSGRAAVSRVPEAVATGLQEG